MWIVDSIDSVYLIASMTILVDQPREWTKVGEIFRNYNLNHVDCWLSSTVLLTCGHASVKN